ncbi:MAG: zinc ribbon domain-containing protein [Ktedonobacteraceae bacterium]
MTQRYIVPNIYQDISNQSQGYFAFRFSCQECYWSVDTMPIRSQVSTATNIMDVGVGLLGGFWGRAAEAGEQIYGSRWHTEQAAALQKAWGEIQHEFHLCPKCHRTVCMRCFNIQLNLCTGSSCAPDLKADGTQFQHQMNIDAQREQIEQNYRAPQFNTNAIPSAASADMLMPPQLPQGIPQQAPIQQPQAPTPAAIAGFNTPGYPQAVMCPTCRRMGPPGKYCQDCGTKLPLPDLFCPNCSTTLETTARFCPECGTKLQMAT